MKIPLKFLQIVFGFLIVLTSISSCDKDEDVNNQDPDQDTSPALAELIIGSWTITNGTYTSNLTFDDNFSLNDYFIGGPFSGTAVMDWQLTEDTLRVTVTYVTGDYEDYNDMGVGYGFNAKVAFENDQLILSFDDLDYVYTRIPDEKILDKNDLLGTWERIDGVQRDMINFEISDLAFNTGVNSFVDEADYGAADILWDVNGDMLLIYYYGYFYGDYAGYNQVDSGETDILITRVTNSQLSLSISDMEYNYTKIDDGKAYYKSDLDGTIWQYASGNYTEILSFSPIVPGNSINGSSSFIDDGSAGATDDFLWTLCGDLLTIYYRSFVLGDYTGQTGISQNVTVTYRISLTESQLTLHNDGEDIVYTPFPSENIIHKTDLFGEWYLNDDTYYDTLLIADGAGTETFEDGAQSGSAEFSWFLNGNMFTVYFDGAMTGDYEAYNGTSQYTSFTTLVSVSETEMTIESYGSLYVYTKKID